jgi:hypothetical protein
MKAQANIKLWTCPECGRQFAKQNQPHSCREFALERHFEGKPTGKRLYEAFRRALKKTMGPFKIESLECCIHFVSHFTFVAVKIMKGKIRIDFSLGRKLGNGRINKAFKMSANRYLYAVDVDDEEEIDDQLLKWIREAHDKGEKILHPKVSSSIHV